MINDVNYRAIIIMLEIIRIKKRFGSDERRW